MRKTTGTKGSKPLESDQMRYKKETKAHHSAKSKHKHDYRPCVIIFNRMGCYEPKTKTTMGTYCTICGKVDRIALSWREFCASVGMTELDVAEPELDVVRSTLPTFHVDDLFKADKVNLDELEEHK